MTDESHEPDVIGTAGHAISARNERILREFSRNHHLAPELHRLSVITLAIVKRVQIPESELLVRNDNRILRQVERRLRFPDVDHLSFSILKGTDRLSVDCLHGSAELLKILVRRAAVEDDKLCVHEDVAHHLAHVLKVHLECGSVHKRDHLRHFPALRPVRGTELHRVPGSVELDEDALRLMFLLKTLHKSSRQIRLVLHAFDEDIVPAQIRLIVLLLPFLTEKEKSSLAVRKIRTGKHFSNKCRFPAFQKTGNHIYGYFQHIICSNFRFVFCCSFTGCPQTPNSSAIFSSFSFDPMTHRRPV